MAAPLRANSNAASVRAGRRAAGQEVTHAPERVTLAVTLGEGHHGGMNIVVNGQTYDSWDAVPADVREKVAKAGLPDADGNGVPDLFEAKGGLPTGSSTTTSTVVEVNGQSFTSIDQLPPEVRQALQASLGGLLGTPAAPVAPTPPTTPGTPPPGQMVLNGETVTAEGDPAKKGFFKRLFGG
ncbi:MAG: hypothetical protein JWO46_671 [Nocardioidaceae bacterium]|nr:hypothetical protein [Nocardioidaceae bacterium]